MTTIALDSTGLVACDSRETDDGLIFDDDCDKHKEMGGFHIWYAGRSADEPLLVEALQGNQQDKYNANVMAVALVYNDGKFYRAIITKEEGFCIELLRKGNAVALGSGANHALTAMDLGLSAKEAIKYAIKRNAHTGGKIRTWQF